LEIQNNTLNNEQIQAKKIKTTNNNSISEKNKGIMNKNGNASNTIIINGNNHKKSQNGIFFF